MVIDSNIQMPFHPIDMDDLWWYKAKEREDSIEACDSVFGSIFLWSKAYHTEVARIAGCGVVRYYFHGNKMYSYPIGGSDEDKKNAVETLLKLAHANEEILCLTILSEAHRLHAIRYFKGVFEIDKDRDRFDYIYEADRLRTLKGKKLAAKRNHINRFVENHDWSYEPITEENKELCWEMEEQWLLLQMEKEGAKAGELQAEQTAIRRSLDYFEALSLTGGILKADGKVVAFCIGEKLNEDTMVVHFEKAYPDIQGAFQMINQQFAIHNCKNCKYINREEDTGNLGLRKAKLSYYPDSFTKKYYARESEITYATIEDTDEIINLWQQSFGDKEEYIRFYMERRFTDETMLVVRRDGRLVSMAGFLPVKLNLAVLDCEREAEKFDAYYVYAVATHPDCRKMGYASAIIEHAFKKWKKPLILQPASESLEKYYGDLGFVRCFKRYLYDYAENQLSVDNLMKDQDFEIIHDFTKEVIEDYGKKREEFFAGRMYVEWDTEAVTYALLENALCGGYLVKANQGYLLCRVENGGVRIVESLIHFQELSQAFWQKVLQKLCQKEQCHILWVHNRGGMLLPTKDLLAKTGQLEEIGYLGLTLD